MRFVKRQREREEANIGNNIADERSYKARNKIFEIIGNDFFCQVPSNTSHFNSV